MRYLAAFAVLFYCAVSGLPAMAQQARQIDGTYAVQGTNSDGSTYTGTVVIKQEGDRYRFTWLIKNGDTFKGIGAREGNTIVVEWGQKYPVIYEIGNDGVLYGKWDNGRATETLIPTP